MVVGGGRRTLDEDSYVELGSQTVQKQYIETGKGRGKGEEVKR